MYSRIGKAIGVAVFPRRSLTDLIWPVWVCEYSGDRTRSQIFVRGLMDVGRVYIRVSQGSEAGTSGSAAEMRGAD